MKKSKEQKEYEQYQREKFKHEIEYQRHLKEREEILRQETDKAVETVREVIRTAKNREELFQFFEGYIGEDYRHVYTEIVYNRFPITKLEKALK